MKNNKARFQRVRRNCLSLVAVAASVWGYSATYAAESLKEALAAAYSSNPQLEAQRARLRGTDEGVRQAKANYYPSVSASYRRQEGQTKNRQFRDGVRLPQTDDEGNVLPDGFQDKPQETYTLTVDQNLFRGLRTHNEIMQAKEQVSAGRAQLLRVEQEVLLGAVTAYMDVVRDEAVFTLRQNNVVVLERQLAASEDRYRVGEVTRTDVAQSEARLEGAKAALLSAEAALASSRANYERVVGRPPATLKQDEFRPELPASLQDAIDVGIAEAPGVLEAKHGEKAADYAVRAAEGALLPTATLRGEVSRFEGTNFFGTTQQDNISDERKLTLTVSVPLYQGGANYSRIRQAKQNRSGSMLDIRNAERIAQEAVLVAWNDHRAAQGQIKSRDAAVNANEIALEGVRQESEVGSRTTLDVLDAEQELLDARVNLISSQRDERVAAFRLLQSMGRLTAGQLNLGVELYDAEENYKKVSNKPIGW